MTIRVHVNQLSFNDKLFIVQYKMHVMLCHLAISVQKMNHYLYQIKSSLAFKITDFI